MKKQFWLSLQKQYRKTGISQFFQSVRVAIVILVLVVVASILGTLFLQNAQPLEYIKKYGETGFFWIRLLSLDDVYHAWWYKILLVVLTFATVSCLASRLNMKIVRSGSLFVHINIITILVGIVVGRFGEKGFLQVFEGEKNNKMIVEKGFVKNPKTGKMERNVQLKELPFEVALNDFVITRYEKPNERLFILDSTGKSLKSFPVEKGKLLKLPKQKMGLTVMDVYPDMHVHEEVVDDENAPFMPAINVSIDSPQGKGEGWLFAHKDDFMLSPDQKMLVYYRWYESKAEMKKAIKKFEKDGKAMLKEIPHVFQIVSGKDVEPRVLHFVEGKFAENHMWDGAKPIVFDKLQTSFMPLRFLNNARMQTEVVNHSEEYKNPALQLAVGTPETGIQSRWIFANQRDPHSASELPVEFYYSVDFPIKEFISHVKILDQGKEVMRKSLRVNHPAKYKGYMLYQASYDKDNEKWSGIQVTRDPGYPLVFIGFVGMMIGLILMFYVNPILNQRSEKKKKSV